MTTSRRIGTAFETAVVTFFRERGFPWVERRALAGKLDRGDIAGLDWVLECKNERTINLAGYMDEAAAEAKNAGTSRYAAVVKRRGKGVGAAYVVMPLAVFVENVTRECAEGAVFRP